MENDLSELLGNGPYPFPVKEFEEFTECYKASGIVIIINKADLLLSKSQGTHSHDSYEFLIPFVSMPFIGCSGKSYYVRQDSVFPINTNQEHGPSGEMKKCWFTAIQISSELVRKVASGINNQSNIIFKNEEFSFSTELRSLLQRFLEETKNPKAGNKLMADSLGIQIVVQLIRDYEVREEERFKIDGHLKKTGIENVVCFMNENSNNSEYPTKIAAKIANLSDYHFIRSFRNRTGKTPYHFLLDLKIHKAKDLLKDRTLPITEVCFLCGFTNHSHFATTFKHRVGTSPSNFRKTHTIS